MQIIITYVYIIVGVIIIIPTFILSYYSIPIICFFHQ